MCGLAGLIDLSRSTTRDTLTAAATAMADTLAHRGPDSSGVWVDETAGIALGHRRLAIVDLSPAGHQPMLTRDGNFALVYNGLVYNFEELRSELEAVGRRFYSRSDTEVILTAIAEWGLEAAVSRFIGMFAFALWDRRRCHLHLVRDRLGIKPLYYGHLGGKQFAFASELRALRALPSFDNPIDRQALTLYMQRNCVPAPHSIYQNVFKLRPGHILTLSLDTPDAISDEPYWNMLDVVDNGARDPFTGSETEATDELEKLLRDAIRRRLIADVPVGVFLSGGPACRENRHRLVRSATASSPAKTGSARSDATGGGTAGANRSFAGPSASERVALELGREANGPTVTSITPAQITAAPRTIQAPTDGVRRGGSSCRTSALASTSGRSFGSTVAIRIAYPVFESLVATIRQGVGGTPSGTSAGLVEARFPATLVGYRAPLPVHRS